MHLSIGVTGHRDLCESEIPALESLVREFLGGLARQFPRLELQLLSPLAEGSDQLAARIALELGIALVAVLPMEQAEYERDFGSAESLAQFRRLLAAASRVIRLPSIAEALGANAGHRDRHYAQLGFYVSNHCQILLALWDGKAGQSIGGTGQVVRYHLTAVMDGFDEHQSSAELLADNENDLAYHIVCSRNRPGGSPRPGLQPLQCSWLTRFQSRSDSGSMPAEYAEMLERLQEFETDRQRLDRVADRGRAGGLALRAGGDLPEGARQVERLFLDADRLAVRYQRSFNASLYAIHGLAVLMGLSFIVYSEYGTSSRLVWVFLALFFSGLAIHITGHRRQWHRKYLDYRALAEALRVQFYWNLAGVVDSRSVGFAYGNFLQKQDVELGWIRHVMREANLHGALGEEPGPEWMSWVINHWVGSATGTDGQMAYYARKGMHNMTRFRRTEMLGQICLWTGISVALVLALASTHLPPAQQQFLLVLMGILPLIAGVRDAISQKRAEKELIKQYRFMARVFANARKLLDSSPDLLFRRRVLRALGQAALEEGAEWTLMHRARPLEHGRL